MDFWKRKRRRHPDPVDPIAGDPGCLTFKERVDAFWAWWLDRSEQMRADIDAGHCGDLQAEVSRHTAAMWNFAWVFGPPPDGETGHSFTLSGEGDIHRQFLAAYWRDRAPQLPGWTFYASRQPGEVPADQGIQIDDTLFEFGGLWLTPHLREEDEVVDVQAWHPGFAEVDESIRGTVLFIMLDEVLGEFGTGQWLGSIAVGDSELSDAIPALELRQYLHHLELKRGWKKFPPTESWAGLRREPGGRGFLRDDIFVGTTRNFPLVRDVPFEEDPLAGSGAEYVFIAIPLAEIPQEEKLDLRHALEETFESELDPESILHLGGCMGVDHAYIDFLLLDGERSIQDLMRVLASNAPPSGSGLHFFAPHQEARRQILA